MKLNIYEHQKVVKTYTCEKYDVPYGIIEDVAALIKSEELSKLGGSDLNGFIGKVVLGSLPQVHAMLIDMFPGLTEEELRKTTVTDVVRVIVDVFSYTVSLINGLGGKEKN